MVHCFMGCVVDSTCDDCMNVCINVYSLHAAQTIRMYGCWAATLRIKLKISIFLDYAINCCIYKMSKSHEFA